MLALTIAAGDGGGIGAIVREVAHFNPAHIAAVLPERSSMFDFKESARLILCSGDTFAVMESVGEIADMMEGKGKP
jgi:predicted glycoside hydrolase/deacetylase ChbG (UPF0249 family)